MKLRVTHCRGCKAKFASVLLHLKPFSLLNKRARISKFAIWGPQGKPTKWLRTYHVLDSHVVNQAIQATALGTAIRIVPDKHPDMKVGEGAIGRCGPLGREVGYT